MHIELAETFLPHAMLMDIGLPDLDGYHWPRRSGRRRGVADHFIAATGWGQEEDRRRAFQAGFDHHLTKPIAPENRGEVPPSIGGPGSSRYQVIFAVTINGAHRWPPGARIVRRHPAAACGIVWRSFGLPTVIWRIASSDAVLSGKFALDFTIQEATMATPSICTSLG